MHRNVGPPKGSGLHSKHSGRTVAEASQKVVSKQSVVGHLLVSEIVVGIQEVAEVGALRPSPRSEGEGIEEDFN